MTELEHYQAYIDGKFTDAESGAVFGTEDPSRFTSVMFPASMLSAFSPANRSSADAKTAPSGFSPRAQTPARNSAAARETIGRYMRAP